MSFSLLSRANAVLLFVSLVAGPLRPTRALADAAPRAEVVAATPALPLVAPGLGAAGLALLPGAIVHGAGTFAIGDRAAAQRLLVAEAAGLVLMLGSVALLAATGASRRTTGPLVPLTIAGVSVFVLSFAADLYGASTGGRDVTASPFVPWLDTQAGYLYVYDPQFSYRNLAHVRTDLRARRVRAGGELWAALDDDHQRMRTELAVRAFGQTPRRDSSDGSYLELVTALAHRRFGREGFAVTTPELSLWGRLDLAHVGHSLRGAFVEGQLGAGLELYQYDVPGARLSNDAYGLLLARVGAGIYVGDGALRTGELFGYYDHRHDDFAAGFGTEGIGSGFLGHFGLRGHYFFGREWGATGLVEVGSAALVGVGLRYRRAARGGAP